MDKLGTLLNIIGGLLLILSILLTPTLTSITLFSLNIIIVILIMMVKRASWRDWGRVVLEGGSRGLPGIFVRLFDRNNSKLINTQITDDKGRYGFILDEGKYIIDIESDEYESVKDINVEIGDKGILSRDIIWVKRKRKSKTDLEIKNDVGPFGK